MEKLPDQWRSQDLPVLVTAARLLQEEEHPSAHEVATALSIEPKQAIKSIVALDDAAYLSSRMNPGDGGILSAHILGLTERGRRTVGIWPSGEGVDALVDALKQAEAATSDPEEKNIIRRAAGAVGLVSRDIMVDVLAAMAAKNLGA